MRIAVDAMGSDDYPKPDVGGSVLAAKQFGYEILLVGDQARIKQELAQHDVSGLSVDIVPSTQVIEMTDQPGNAAKSKTNSSMHVGMQLVKQGDAQAFVTMGNTGAALTVATLFTLRRIPGIKRPALSGIYPVSDKYITMLDLGANADSKPEWLVQFALMGQIYAQHTLGLQEPRIALLSNGEEEGKGNQLIHESADLLKQTDLNYIGNVEPKDVMKLTADVIVSDGYVGNIFVKTFEASASLISDAIREEARSDIMSSIGGLMMKSAFQRVRKRTSTSELGGAPLLGVNGVVIIGHGRSDAFAIKNAIRQAALAVNGQVIEKIQAAL